MRFRNNPGALAAMLRAEREAVAGPKKVTAGSSAAASYGGQYIPGLAPAAEESKNAARNKCVGLCGFVWVCVGCV